MMRNLLRKLIGWDEIERQYASSRSISKLWSHINALKAENKELREMIVQVGGQQVLLASEIESLRAEYSRLPKRTPKPQVEFQSPSMPQTWEEVQAAFMANEENFKEQS